MPTARVSREYNTRKATKRPEGWKPPNSLPDDINLGPEWVCRYIRKFVNGVEEDKTAFFRRKQRGWVPVKPEEVPHLAHLAQDGLIQASGCVLCKISRAVAEADVEYYEQQALGAYQGAMQEFVDDANDKMPKFNESKRPKVIRGRIPSSEE